MFKKLDTIVLITEIPLDHIWDIPPGSPLLENGSPRRGLQAGDVGTIVYIHCLSCYIITSYDIYELLAPRPTISCRSTCALLPAP